MTKKKQIGKSLSAEAMRIAMNQVGNVEAWVARVGKEDPEAAVKLWMKLAEFGEPKNDKSKTYSGMNIQINMIPSRQSQDVIDISENAEMNTRKIPPSEG